VPSARNPGAGEAEVGAVRERHAEHLGVNFTVASRLLVLIATMEQAGDLHGTLFSIRE